MDNNISRYLNESMPENRFLTELYRGRLVSENSVDYIVPNDVADADSILLCTAEPKIEGKYLGETTVGLEGTAAFSLLLATEGNTLSSLRFIEPFETEAAVDGLGEDCSISCLTSMEYVTARLVNPRKVNIRYQVNTDIRVFRRLSAEPVLRGTMSLEEDMRLQRHRQSLRSAEPVSFEEKELRVSRDIELDGSCPQAEEILLTRIRLLPGEVRVRENGAEVKTDALVNLVCRTENGNYFTADKKFTLSNVIEGAGDPGCEWNAAAAAGEATVRIAANSYGEMKMIELDFPYDLTLTGMKNRQSEAVTDLYSTEYECEVEWEEKPVTVFRRCVSGSLSVNAGAPRSELHAEGARAVFTGAVTLKNISARYLPEKNKLLTEGKAEIHLVVENDIALESEKLFGTAVFEYPFRCETEASEELASADLIVECAVGDTRFRADSQSLYCDFELSVRILALDTASVRYVSAAALNREAAVSRSDAPILLSYPSEDQTLWDIAKHYKVAPESVMAANGMTGEELGDRKVLLIPRPAPRASAPRHL